MAMSIPVRWTYIAHGILALFAFGFGAINLYAGTRESMASLAGLGVFLAFVGVIPVCLALLVAAYSVVAVFRVHARDEAVPRDMIVLPIGLVVGACGGLLIQGGPFVNAVLLLAYALMTFVIIARFLRGSLLPLASLVLLTVLGLAARGMVPTGSATESTVDRQGAKPSRSGGSNSLRAVLEASGPNADLINAIEAGDTASVRMLLQHGRDPNAPGYQGQLPLVAAAQTHDAGCLRLLIDHGATPDAADFFDRTPLMLAARSGDSAVVSILLGLGANPNRAVHSTPPVRATEIGYTPLLFACEHGSPAVVRLLVRGGANLDARVVNREYEGLNGRTPILTAAERGHAEIAGFLAGSGARFDAERVNEALLRGAALHGDTTQVRALLERGTAVNSATAYEKWTPLMKALRATREWDRDMEPPGSWSRDHAPRPSPAVVRVLIAAGGDVNARDFARVSVLGMAIGENSGPEIVRLLLAAGARGRIHGDFLGDTPLSIARANVKHGIPNSREILEMLEHVK